MAFDTVGALRTLVADTLVLQMKTQNYHWNMVGSDFYELHLLFEGQYTALFGAVDEVAEHLRTMGATPPSTLADVLRLTRLKEGVAGDRDAMVADLAESHAQVGAYLRAAIKQMDNEPVSQDLVVRRVQEHDKAAWMLRSSVSKAPVTSVAPTKTATKPVAKSKAKAKPVAKAPAQPISSPAPKVVVNTVATPVAKAKPKKPVAKAPVKPVAGPATKNAAKPVAKPQPKKVAAPTPAKKARKALG